MILDAKGRPYHQTDLDRATAEMSEGVARALYGDGGPLIVPPGWKPPNTPLPFIGLAASLDGGRTYTAVPGAMDSLAKAVAGLDSFPHMR